MKIYLAGSCSSENRTLMVSIATIFRAHGHEVYCPFELKIPDAWNYSQEDWSRMVFNKDIEALNAAEAFVFISFGRVSTSGSNWEQGYIFARGTAKICVIQVTDEPTSLMTYCGCDCFFNADSTDEVAFTSLINNIAADIENYNDIHVKCKTILT